MDEKLFQECLEAWKTASKNESYWKELGTKYGIDGEILRSRWKRIRKKLGITKENSNVVNTVIPKENKSKAKILCLDIETSPISCYTWSLWPDSISPDAIIQDWHIISWSAKWIFEPEIMSDVLTSDEAKKHDDSRICKSIWNLLNETNIVLSHNGNSFDIKRLNTRFLYNGMIPPTPYQSIDTLLIAKNTFDFTSRKLDYINQYLGLPSKEHTEFKLWKNCFNGDPDALAMMEHYNRTDCEILEDLYLKLRPYIKGHPNMNLWSDDNISICPNCGSNNLDWNVKEYFTYTGCYKGFRCLDCGATGRSRLMDLDKDKRKSLVVSTK